MGTKEPKCNEGSEDVGRRQINLGELPKEVREFFQNLDDDLVWLEDKGKLLWILQSAAMVGLEGTGAPKDSAGGWSTMPVEIAREIIRNSF